MRFGAPAPAAAGLACLTVIVANTAHAKDEAFVSTTIVNETVESTTMTFDFEAPVYKNVHIGADAWTTIHLGNESVTACAGEPGLPDVRRSVMIGDDALVGIAESTHPRTSGLERIEEILAVIALEVAVADRDRPAFLLPLCHHLARAQHRAALRAVVEALQAKERVAHLTRWRAEQSRATQPSRVEQSRAAEQ